MFPILSHLSSVQRIKRTSPAWIELRVTTENLIGLMSDLKYGRLFMFQPRIQALSVQEPTQTQVQIFAHGDTVAMCNAGHSHYVNGRRGGPHVLERAGAPRSCSVLTASGIGRWGGGAARLETPVGRFWAHVRLHALIIRGKRPRPTGRISSSAI